MLSVPRLPLSRSLASALPRIHGLLLLSHLYGDVLIRFPGLNAARHHLFPPLCPQSLHFPTGPDSELLCGRVFGRRHSLTHCRYPVLQELLTVFIPPCPCRTTRTLSHPNISTSSGVIFSGSHIPSIGPDTEKTLSKWVLNHFTDSKGKGKMGTRYNF